jgi:hypothetical protein
MRNISEKRNEIINRIKTMDERLLGKTSYTPLEEEIISKRAEIWAFREKIIPHGYVDVNINDLTGFSTDNEELLSSKVAARVKREIINLLWPSLSLEKIRDMDVGGKDRHVLCDKSNIMKYRTKGTNIIIYGPHNSGKTLCAATFMNHILDMHVYGYDQTYDWIDFSVLQENLIRRNDEETTYLKSVDWLVIDDIELMSGASRQSKKYITAYLNPFFVSRVEDRYPTIFIFGFDVESKSKQELQDSYGLTLTRIISSKQTIKMRLFDDQH